MKNADLIVALQEGKVVETGTHNELMNRRAFYYNFVMLQTIAEEVAKEADSVSVISGEDRGKPLVSRNIYLY